LCKNLKKINAREQEEKRKKTKKKNHCYPSWTSANLSDEGWIFVRIPQNCMVVNLSLVSHLYFFVMSFIIFFFF